MAGEEAIFLSAMATGTLSPLEEERSELGYKLVEVRDGRQLRVVYRPCDASDVCLFFVHGGGGRAGQFKHLIKAFESTYVIRACAEN